MTGSEQPGQAPFENKYGSANYNSLRLHFSVSTSGFLLSSTISSQIGYYSLCSLTYGAIVIHFFGHVLTQT